MLRHAPLSVAPMMDWTDRHCRFFHRLLAPSALLYTEMVTTGAILHGDLDKLLGHHPSEQPCVLQLGGSEPEDLARAAAIGEQWGYAGLNLNCGCPSERVQKGAFGACLMREPSLVADCVRAMREAVGGRIPVTVKHRIGVDGEDRYDLLADFVNRLAEAGCDTFVVHARTAILKGLSPKENREVPPLRPDLARRLKADFPRHTFIYNGGLITQAASLAMLSPTEDGPALDGVMLGRAAYHDPWLLRDLAAALGDQQVPQRREDVVPALQAYFADQLALGVPAKTMARHWHGLYHGQMGARYWRRALSEGESPAETLAAMRLARDPIATDAKTPSPSTSQPAASQASVA